MNRMAYTNETRTEAERIISEARQAQEWRNYLSENAEIKKAKTILMRELKNDMAQDNAKAWEIRVALTRLEFKYDYEAILNAIQTITENVRPAIQERKVAVREQAAAKNETRQ
jgi:hypothetical protein